MLRCLSASTRGEAMQVLGDAVRKGGKPKPRSRPSRERRGWAKRRSRRWQLAREHAMDGEERHGMLARGFAYEQRSDGQWKQRRRACGGHAAQPRGHAELKHKGDGKDVEIACAGWLEGARALGG
eukprot:1870479-Pleurochrysis_carterae.AAC.1